MRDELDADAERHTAALEAAEKEATPKSRILEIGISPNHLLEN
jgi:hypothetical protein